MTSYVRALPALALLVVTACGSAATPATAPGSGRLGALPPPADAPYELANDFDLDEVRDQYEALIPQDASRARVRAELAEEYGRRIDHALQSAETHHDAYARLLDLASLWTPEELADPATAAALAPYSPHAQRIRAVFARAGGDTQAVAALYFLLLAEPQASQQHAAELEQIFAYADTLAVAQYGAGAQGSRVIAMLEEITEEAPLPAAVDRLVASYAQRQAMLQELFQKGQAGSTALLAHGDGVIRVTYHVVRVLARAHRLGEAPAVLASITKLGDNRILRDTLAMALAPEATGERFVELATIFAEVKMRDEEAAREPKLRGLLAIAREGMRRFPEHARLAALAGETARKLENVYLAIAMYEEALRRDPNGRAVAGELAELYQVRVTAQAFFERPLAARKRLEELETFQRDAAQRWPEQPLSSDLADAYAAMGRGMASLGQLDEAARYLERSLAVRPTFGALEQLGSIALKQDRHQDAVEIVGRALSLRVDNPLDSFNRAKIMRLYGDALAAAGRQEQAHERWAQAIDEWLKLEAQVELPVEYKAEMLIESGKAQWSLGDRDTALQALELAVDIDPEGADTHSTVVAFLIVRGEYRSALDVFHRALGSYEISDYSKVYMSLWVLAEARRAGLVPDRLVISYLESRDGRLWHDDLARLATGRASTDALQQRANTRARRAELLYYTAVLGTGEAAQIRTLLRGVVATDMVFFYEYEMAKHWLAEGFAPTSAGAPVTRARAPAGAPSPRARTW